MKRLLLSSLVLCAVAIAAGCGGGGSGGERLSKADYEQELAAGGMAIQDAFEALALNIQELQGGEIGSLDEATDVLAQMAAEVDAVVASLRDAGDELDGINPPGDVETAHTDLRRGVQLLADDLERFADTVESGDFQAIQEASTELANLEASEAGQLLQSAIEEIRAKGYDLGGE